MDNRVKNAKGAYLFTLLKLVPSLAVVMLSVGIKPSISSGASGSGQKPDDLDGITQARETSVFTREDGIILSYCESRFGNCSIKVVDKFVRVLLDEIYCFTGFHNVSMMFRISRSKLNRFIAVMTDPFEVLEMKITDKNTGHTIQPNFKSFYHDLERVYDILKKDIDDPSLKIITSIPYGIDPTESKLVGLQLLTYPRYNMSCQDMELEIRSIIEGRSETSKYAYLHCAQDTVQKKILELAELCTPESGYQASSLPAAQAHPSLLPEAVSSLASQAHPSLLAEAVSSLAYQPPHPSLLAEAVATRLIHYLTKRYIIMDRIKNTAGTDPSLYDFRTVYLCAERAFIQGNESVDLRSSLDNYWKLRRINSF